MATRAPFLTQPYGAYYHRDSPKEDEELTDVGPGTPCGEYLRRFWQASGSLQGVAKSYHCVCVFSVRTWSCS